MPAGALGSFGGKLNRGVNDEFADLSQRVGVTLNHNLQHH